MRRKLTINKSGASAIKTARSNYEKDGWSVGGGSAKEELRDVLLRRLRGDEHGEDIEPTRSTSTQSAYQQSRRTVESATLNETDAKDQERTENSK